MISKFPSIQRDFLPLLLIPAAALLAFLFIDSVPTWLTLTMAGLAMGMMIFIIASGLTLIFGLMDVLNFGHGAFIGIGAYLTLSILVGGSGLGLAYAGISGVVLLYIASLGAALVAALIGFFFEKLLIRRVYGDHLKQILITMGGAIVIEQIMVMIWGPYELQIALPDVLKGSVGLFGASIEKFRIMIVIQGMVLFLLMLLLLHGTRLGLLVRAGVEDSEMVQSLGFNIKRIFIGVFVVGSALAGFGGAMWALYRGTLTANLGGELMITVFIVIVMGGLGSLGGCFIAALLVAVVSNYVAFVMPGLAAASAILIMAAVLIWRPSGLYPIMVRK
ncbi:branched-chain amino acid ABC transporter permease [Alcaligenaceae bacterium]|nr:branched-chain amino acid ABC transporter permease [Alcaligenaceae bacterium]